MKNYIALVALGFGFQANATNIDVKFDKQLKDFNTKTVYLREIVGNDINMLDSTKINNNIATFSDQNLQPGFYELFINSTNRIDFLVNNQEQISAQVNSSPIQNEVKFEDEENKQLWSYKYFTRKLNSELSSFEKAKEVSKNNVFDAKIDSINQIKDIFQIQFINSTDGLLVNEIVKASSQDLMINKGMDYRKEHFFDEVNFNNPALVRSFVLPKIIVEYLQVHTNHNELGFQETVDKILDLASVNTEVYNFCLSHLLTVFNKVGPAITFQYIVENHLLQNGCVDELNNEELAQLALDYAQTMPGKLIPEVTLQDVDGSSEKLNDLIKVTDQTILFFWSSHCQFCHEAIPELNDLMGELNENAQLVTISLDKNKSEWTKAFQTTFKGGKHYCDLQGWQSEAVKKFKVHKTPSFYVVNNAGVILSKPADIDGLVNYFKDSTIAVK